MNWGPLPGADRPAYDGANLAANGGICVVAANYRLGVLGFLVLDDDAKGNQAIQDQRAAMQWTRDNIAAFGGDPDAITIGGQSAGAMSTAVHLVSPHSAGLFHRAILQSAVAAFQYQRASVQTRLRPQVREPDGLWIALEHELPARADAAAGDQFR